MARKKDYIIENPPEDLGVKLYSYGDADGKNKKASAEKPWRSPPGIFLLAVLAFLVFWFFYSLIYAFVHGNAAVALIYHLDGLFALVVCGTIIIASVFKLWVKIGRWALNRGMVRRSEAAQAEQQVDMMEAAYDKMEQPAPFIEIYGSFLRATDNDGKIKVFDFENIRQVEAFKRGGKYKLALRFLPYGFEFLSVLLPKRDIKKLQALLGEKFKLFTTDSADETVRKAYRAAAKETGGVRVGVVIIGILCAAVGGGVIAMHFYLSAQIPIALGAFFMAGGVLLTFVAFEHNPVVKTFFIPFIFGGIFCVIPPLFCGIIADGQGISLPASLGEFLASFTGLYCGVLFLCCLGLMFIVVAFTNLVKYIKTGEY